MATKKNNTKKADNKPETKEEIVEIKEKEIEEVVEETTEQHDEAIRNYLNNKGMDDEFINNVLNNEELEKIVKALMETEQNKPSLKERVKKYASDKKEAIQNTAIVVGATAVICGVVYAVCNVADDGDEREEDEDPYEVVEIDGKNMVKTTIYLDIPETESEEITEIDESVKDSEEITEAEEA